MHLPRKNRTKKMRLLSINLLVSIVDLERAEIKALTKPLWTLDQERYYNNG